MNIFVLDRDPVLAAKYHCDKHVGKMILESAQMMSSIHHLFETPQAPYLYKQTHLNHPCTVWARETTSNYRWLFRLYQALGDEFFARRGKPHKSMELEDLLFHIPSSIPEFIQTPFAQAMPDEYKEPNEVSAYRSYYFNEKRDIAQWNWLNNTPEWWKQKQYYTETV